MPTPPPQPEGWPKTLDWQFDPEGLQGGPIRMKGSITLEMAAGLRDYLTDRVPFDPQGE
jgi:hypothetical protein